MKPIFALASGLFLAPPWAYASDSCDAQPLAEIDRTKYAPYPQQDFPDRVFFGNTRLHTSDSADAGMIRNTLGPEEAYRFARGETAASSTGIPAKSRATRVGSALAAGAGTARRPGLNRVAGMRQSEAGWQWRETSDDGSRS